MKNYLFLLFALMVAAANAAEVNLDSLAGVPVLDGGRVKPMDSFAREQLLVLSGKRKLKNMSAIEWFALVLFDPRKADATEVFIADNPAVFQAIGLDKRGRGRVSYEQLMPHLESLSSQYEAAAQKTAADQTTDERQILELGLRVSSYVSMLERLTPSIKDFGALGDAAQAYQVGDQAAFDAAMKTLTDKATKAHGEDAVKIVGPEIIFNKLDPFFKAELLFGLVMILWLFSLIGKKKLLSQIAIVAGIAAILLVTYGIGVRMLVMGRPPVTNLFSTFVFTAWMCSLLGTIIYFWRDRSLGLLSIGVFGLVFLRISSRYAEGGDTMGVMVAVLNSNFWLATHVVTIMIGYSGCCLAGLIGHVQLIQEYWLGKSDSEVQKTFKTLHGVLGFGLVFTFVGTVLGGIWADQSWGRFWGWDPKENGALLIVLWCALVIHGRVGGMIKRTGFAAGCVLGIQMVLIAWFGVNLLGVGLHSYGRDSNSFILYYLVGFLILEIVFLLAMVPLWWKKHSGKISKKSAAVESSAG